jgi:hypothetical protein
MLFSDNMLLDKKFYLMLSVPIVLSDGMSEIQLTILFDNMLFDMLSFNKNNNNK